MKFSVPSKIAPAQQAASFAPSIPAPYGYTGLLSMTAMPEDAHALTTVKVADYAVEALRRFCPSFLNLALMAGVAGYTARVHEVLVASGVDGTFSKMTSRDSWPLIYINLCDFSIRLETLLMSCAWQPEDAAATPIGMSLIHTWCVVEAARCYTSVMDPGGSIIPELHADAVLLENVFGPESDSINDVSCPYLAVRCRTSTQ